MTTAANENLVGGTFLGGGELTNFQLVGETSHHPPSRVNPAYCNLVSYLSVLIFKTNNLQKEKDYPRPVWMMGF